MPIGERVEGDKEINSRAHDLVTAVMAAVFRLPSREALSAYVDVSPSPPRSPPAQPLQQSLDVPVVREATPPPPPLQEQKGMVVQRVQHRTSAHEDRVSTQSVARQPPRPDSAGSAHEEPALTDGAGTDDTGEMQYRCGAATDEFSFHIISCLISAKYVIVIR